MNSIKSYFSHQKRRPKFQSKEQDNAENLYLYKNRNVFHHCMSVLVEQLL